MTLGNELVLNIVFMVTSTNKAFFPRKRSMWVSTHWLWWKIYNTSRSRDVTNNFLRGLLDTHAFAVSLFKAACEDFLLCAPSRLWQKWDKRDEQAVHWRGHIRDMNINFCPWDIMQIWSWQPTSCKEIYFSAFKRKKLNSFFVFSFCLMIRRFVLTLFGDSLGTFMTFLKRGGSMMKTTLKL